jgi:MerR family transcriptional regulator, light-induced transcriptional regulator
LQPNNKLFPQSTSKLFFDFIFKETMSSLTTDTTPLFTASEVEARTGVPATTLRQWERRYGVPNPERTPSGYRMYSPLDMACIEFIKNHILEGIPVSRASQLWRESASQTSSNALHPKAIPASVLVEEMIAATLESDMTRAEKVLAQAHAIMPVEDVVLQVIQPTLVEIGEKWHRGEITIAHEHQATSFIKGRLLQLFEMAGSPRGGPVAVIACGPGEYHEIGALAIGIFLRRAGIRTHYLGANMPMVDLARFSREVRAAAVMISCGSPEVVDALRPQIHLLREVVPVLIFGGRAFTERPHLAKELGGEFAGSDAAQALDHLLGVFDARKANA